MAERADDTRAEAVPERWQSVTDLCAALGMPVQGDTPTVEDVTDFIRALAGLRPFEEDVPPAAACAVCKDMRQHLMSHQSVDGLVCAVCWRIADRILREFQESARRHWREVRAQIPQAILDIRAGAPSPVFYRGFE